MRSPIAALTWEIWRKNRGWACLIIGMIIFGRIWMAFFQDRYRPGQPWMLIFVMSVLFTFGLFNYTEVSPQRTAAGFPHRLYTLPVSSLLLVTVPTVWAILSLLLVRFAWTCFNGIEISPFITVKLMTFAVLYQSILWVLDAFGVLRIIVLGIVATWLIAFGFPVVPEANTQALENIRIVELLLLSGAVFLVSWGFVARRRSGVGNSGPGELKEKEVFAGRFSERLLRRSKSFSSPAAAQFWFEWRRSGRVLPFYVGLLFLVVFGPMSMYASREAASTLRILAAAVAMPIILALPIGKGFSKPDFWSKDMALTSFLAVRPLTTGDLVMIKARVAGRSAFVSWALAFAFLSLWIPSGADISLIRRLWLGLCATAGSGYSAAAILGLSILAGIFLTWRFLVSSLWLGLAGNRIFYAWSAVPYVVWPVAGLIGLTKISHDWRWRLTWIFQHRDQVLTNALWIGAIAVIVRFGFSVLVWRRIPTRHLWQYLPVWTGATLCLTVLTMLVWNALRPMLPPDMYRLQVLLILAAVSTMPLGRLGLASLTLARNRHR
jgi:hypothetical protein